MPHKLIYRSTVVNTECGSFKVAIFDLNFVTGNTAETFQQNLRKKKEEFIYTTEPPSATTIWLTTVWKKQGPGVLSSLCLAVPYEAA